MKYPYPYPGWHPADTLAKLKKKGLALVGVSRTAELPDHAARHALRYPYPAAEAAIAKALGVKPQTIWPHRYDAQGETLHPPRRHHPVEHSTGRAEPGLQKGLAA